MLFIALFLAADLPKLGLPANREPINAACMLEIVNSPAEREKLKQEAFREGAKRKVRVLSSMLAEQLRLVEKNRLLWPGVEKEQRDLYEHGLISQKEWTAFQEGAPDRMAAHVAATMRNWPNCHLLDQASDSPSKQAIINTAQFK